MRICEDISITDLPLSCEAAFLKNITILWEISEDVKRMQHILKAVWHEILSCKFFWWFNFPRAAEYPIWTISSFFSKICGNIREWMFISSVNDNGDKFIGGVVDTEKQFFDCVNSVNFRLFGYFWLVLMTPEKNVIASVKDTSDKFITGVNDTSEQLIDGVVDTGKKSFIRKYPRKFLKKVMQWSVEFLFKFSMRAQFHFV